MNKQRFFRVIGQLDDRIIERYYDMDARLARRQAYRRAATHILTAAACFVLVIALCLPLAALAHPAGRAVLRGDSAALTEYLIGIDGFAAWQERTAEKLEHVLPEDMWELLETVPIIDVLTQSQYPVYAWKGATFKAYMQEPVCRTYEVSDPERRLLSGPQIDVRPQQYRDNSAAQTYTLELEDEVYVLSYIYSQTHSLQHQPVHVYRLYTENGPYYAYVDVQSGECVYWERPERADEMPEDGVLQDSMTAQVYQMLAEKVRDPEAYTIFSEMQGEYFVCEYNRVFNSFYATEKVTPFAIQTKSCDGITVTFDKAGNIICCDLGYLGSLRSANTEIPTELFSIAYDYICTYAQSYSGTGTESCIVITPDGRLAYASGMKYLLHPDDYAAEAKYLAYLTDPDSNLAELAYQEELKLPEGLRVKTKEIRHSQTFENTSINEYEYDADGRMISEIMIVDGVEDVRMTYKYDENGRKIESKTVSAAAPAAGGTLKFFYDENGQEIRRESYDNRGKLLREYFFEYDDQGRVIKEEYGQYVTTYTYGEHGSYVMLEQSTVGDYAKKFEYFFDASGNYLGYKSYDKDAVASEIVYKYNEDNQKIGWAAYANGEMVAYNVTEYRDGKEYRTLNYQDGKLVGINTYWYNQFGECIGEEYVGADGKLIESSEYVYEFLNP